MGNAPQELKLECLEIKQPIGHFYITVMDSSDIEYLTYVDVRRLEKKERDIEHYTGIQRPLKLGRVKKIGKYVNLIDATFPSSIIVSIPGADAHFDSDLKILTIPYKDNLAKVIDGQHRIAGFENYNGVTGSFQVCVTIFVDMDIENEAMVFSTINQTHDKVSKSLAVDLFEYTKARSPQKSVHDIIRALDQNKKSPFHEKIKILGTAIDKDKESITQATFSEALLKLITKDPVTDRDRSKRGQPPETYSEADYQKFFLRKLWEQGEDVKIANIISQYFKAVQNKWGTAWDELQPELILNRSTGFLALMRYFPEVYTRLIENESELVTAEQYKIYFEPMTLEGDDMNKHKYVPGSSGVKLLYDQLMEVSVFD